MDQMCSIDERLKGLNLSKEESDKFTKAFKDPKFIELFADYAKEVSDPKVKEETDQYLRQLEAEGRGEEVYGKDVTLLVPEEAFVVKAMESSTGKRAYINMCTSNKIDPLRLSPMTNAYGRRGQQVEIPLSLGPCKEGQDKEGGMCLVFDFVVAPATLDAAHANPGLMQTVVETAMENIERGHGVKLGPKFKQLKLKYKATPEVPTPHVLSVRGSKGEGKPPAMAACTPSSTPAQPRLPGLETQQQQQQLQLQGRGSRSSFSFASKQKDQPRTETDPSKAGYRHKGGEVTPMWSLTHRGEVDLAQCWGDASRNLAMAPASYPQALVVRLQLPEVFSAAGVELDVGAHSLCVVVPGKYRLETPLPYPVKDEEGKAKFDKVKSVLEVVLPTQPPALPQQPPAAPVAAIKDGALVTELQNDEGTTEAPMASPKEQERQQGGQDAPEGEPGESQDPEKSAGGDAEEVEGFVMVTSPSVKARSKQGESSELQLPPGGSTEAQCLTENQRKWLEVHSHSGQQQQQQEGQAQSLACSKPAASGCAFEAADRFQGSKEGWVFKRGDKGLGYYVDSQQQQQQQPSEHGSGKAGGGAAAHKALAALRHAGVAGPRGVDEPEGVADALGQAPSLKPRLLSSLAHELD